MTIRDRVSSLVRRLRRWMAARWHQMGLRLFPRVHDTVLDRPADAANLFRIIHRYDGLDEYVAEETVFSKAIVAWAVAVADKGRFPGELQFWKNGKLRDSREAVT